MNMCHQISGNTHEAVPKGRHTYHDGGNYATIMEVGKETFPSFLVTYHYSRVAESLIILHSALLVWIVCVMPTHALPSLGLETTLS